MTELGPKIVSLILSEFRSQFNSDICGKLGLTYSYVLNHHLSYLPMVEIKVESNALSEKRNKISVFPTPESPIRSTLKR